MSLEIQVKPEAVRSLTEKARSVPNDRISKALDDLDELESTLSSWKGDGKPAYESLHADIKSTLTSTQELMNAMLSSLDLAIDDFSKIDKDISSKFDIVVDNYTDDK